MMMMVVVVVVMMMMMMMMMTAVTEQMTTVDSSLVPATEEVKEAKTSPEKSRLASILPDLVVKLDANDEFLKARIRDLPASLVEGTNNEEKAFLARLGEYRRLNTVESSIEDHLDELEFNISFFGELK